jgi:hypothetical protein
MVAGVGLTASHFFCQHLQACCHDKNIVAIIKALATIGECKSGVFEGIAKDPKVKSQT